MFLKRLLVSSALAAVAIALACKGGSKCDNIQCGAGLVCDDATGTCKPSGVTTGCPTACSGRTPICDTQSSTCVTCTAQQGCGTLLPICDTSVSGGKCVECLGNGDCTAGQNHVCDTSSHTCVSGSGGGAGGGVGGGAGGGGGGGVVDAGPCGHFCGGSTPFCDEDAGQCVSCQADTDCPGWFKTCVQGTCVLQPSAYKPDGATCIDNTYDAGACSPGCNEGFTCVNGACELRGSQGGVQVSLYWDTDEDLDLHVDEPIAGGSCEIYYGDPSMAPDGGGGANAQPSSCGAQGWLDLDSNAGCSIDGVDIENIIYPGGVAAPSGTYNVRVDFYEGYDPSSGSFNTCANVPEIPYAVKVRANGSTTVYCDVFKPTDQDMGGQNAGRAITSFNVP